MAERDAHARARELAAESLGEDEPTAWFERLYAQAEQGTATVPWDQGAPQQLLVDWAQERGLDGSGWTAIVVGAGLGRDAEYLAGLGFDTVAFDVSETAVAVARSRNPTSRVRYYTADLLTPPHEWLGGFDFVMESLTVQSLPEPPRHEAIARVREIPRPGGHLLVIANARDEEATVDGPPWPLKPSEIDLFAGGEIREVRRERVPDDNDPAVHRWRVGFSREPSP